MVDAQTAKAAPAQAMPGVRVGRNDPAPAAVVKYKQCHGKLA